MWPYMELTNGDVVRPVAGLGYVYDELIGADVDANPSAPTTAPPASSGHSGHDGPR